MTKFLVVDKLTSQNPTAISPESVLIEVKKKFVFRGREIKVFSPYAKHLQTPIVTDFGLEMHVVDRKKDSEVKQAQSGSLRTLQVF